MAAVVCEQETEVRSTARHHQAPQGVEERTETSSEIVSAARRRLAETSHLFLRTVGCRCSDGNLILHGRVPSFYLKQVAQSALQGLRGVHRIDNQLVVVNSYGLSSEPQKD